VQGGVVVALRGIVVHDVRANEVVAASERPQNGIRTGLWVI
jgi:hypothetical protein